MALGDALQFIHMQVQEGIIPSAAVALGRGDRCYALEVFGNARVHPSRQPATFDTLYDLASLTKTMATAMVALKLVEQGRLSLYDTLGDWLDAPADKRSITLKELMTHTGGFPVHILLEKQVSGPAQAAACLLGLPLERPAGQQVVYSCLGYILLGWALERAGGAPLDQLADRLVFRPLGMARTGFRPQGGDVAATECDAVTGQPLQGLAHDENARFLGGVAGNAGLFSTVGDCARFAAMLSQGGSGFLPAALFACMVANHTPGMAESRGLGFRLADGRPLSCGELVPMGSFGHTGFTGTSLWVDAQTGFYAVLLTNAVHFGRERDAFFRVRRVFHNLAWLQYAHKEATL